MPASRRDFLRTVSHRTLAMTTTAIALQATSNRQAAANQPNTPPIKIGQIGVGHAHASKLSVYRNSPDYEVVGIVEPNESLRQRAAEQAPYRDLPWMTTEQLLNQPNLQAVLVETTIDGLLPNAALCVTAGKHVHVDKPAGENLAEWDRILKIAEAKQLYVQMGYMYRYNPGMLLLKEFLREGWLGDVFEVHAVMSKVVDAANRIEHAKYSGGMMFELGCHLIDLVVQILGAPTEVQSWLQHTSSANDTLADNTLAVLTYPRAMATVRSTGQEVDGGSRRHLVVCGTKGTFQIQPLDNPTVTVNLAQPVGNYSKGSQTIKLPKFERYIADAADMAKIIRGEKLNDLSYEHDRIVQSVVLRASKM